MRYSDNRGCKLQNSTSGLFQKEHRVFMQTEAWCGRDDSAAPVASQIPGKYLCFLVTRPLIGNT